MAGFGCSGLPGCLNGYKVEYSIPGHPNRRNEAIPFLKEKFIKNASPYLKEEANNLWENILQIDIQSEFEELLNILNDD